MNQQLKCTSVGQDSVNFKQGQVGCKKLAWWRDVVFVIFIVGLMAMGRGAWAFSCDDVTEIPKVECEALVALYDSTDGDNWTNNTDWLDTNMPCSWHGLTCSDGHVSSLQLHVNQLVGIIPTELGNLANLQYISLSNNQLSGNIPSELGNLSNLQNLHLAYNKLTGTIPAELGNLANLQSLILYNNQLSGNIPSELDNLSNLQYLDLYKNQLSGNIPSELGNLANLQYISLSNNQLSGNIPSELGNLSKLQYFYLYNNQLSGTIPSELGNLSNLYYVNFTSNDLCGNVSQSFTNLNNIIESSWRDQKPCSTPTTCQLYAVHDEGLNNSQFFTISSETFEIKALGGMYKAHDIEALDIHPQTGELFAASGKDTNKPAHLYNVNKITGNLTEIGSTGLKEIDGLSFHPDGTLWGWSTGDGLVTIDTTTGKANLEVPYQGEIEDLTWNTFGSMLYGVENLRNNPDSGVKLLASDGNTVVTICEELTKSLEIEALDALPDDTLIFGLHGKNNLPLGVIDVNTCQITANTEIATNYDDVEGIAWPNCQ